jgi:periplasmic protein TonB
MVLNQDAGFFTRRSLLFFVIVGIHVALVWVLNSELSSKLVQLIGGPMETTIIDEIQDADEPPPPPPPPDIDAPPPFVPAPDIAIALAPDTTTTAIQAVTNTRPPPAAPPPAPAARAPVVVLPKQDPRRGITQPEYPPASRRAGEAGTVQLRVYVLENGRVREAQVSASSGFPRLDEAAVREATRAWRFVPGTQDGKPAAMWHEIKVTFRLTD